MANSVYSLSIKILELMFGPMAGKVIDAMKEVMTPEEITNCENISLDRMKEIIKEVQKYLNNE